MPPQPARESCQNGDNDRSGDNVTQKRQRHRVNKRERGDALPRARGGGATDGASEIQGKGGSVTAERSIRRGKRGHKRKKRGGRWAEGRGVKKPSYTAHRVLREGGGRGL